MKKVTYAREERDGKRKFVGMIAKHGKERAPVAP